MLDQNALEDAAKIIDPEMWSPDAENYLDAFDRKPFDNSRYWDFVTKHGELAVGVRRAEARNKARAAITAYLKNLPAEPVAWQRRQMYSDIPGYVPQWQFVSKEEATGHFERRPGYEYRPLYASPIPVTDDAVERAAKALQHADAHYATYYAIDDVDALTLARAALNQDGGA